MGVNISPNQIPASTPVYRAPPPPQKAQPLENTYVPSGGVGGAPEPTSGYSQANPFQNRAGGSSPFDYLRKQATDNAGNQEAQGLDALTRRFAAMGSLNSGANIKATEDNTRTATANAENAKGQIDMAENAQALPYAQMAQQNQQFGRSLGETQAARQQQSNQFGQEIPLKQRQLDLESSQQDMDREANAFNERMGQFQANHSGGMFGQSGFLGLGLGTGGNGWAEFGG